MEVPFIDFIQNMSKTWSKCLSGRILRINWIISRIPHRISEILFVLGSYEYLERLEGKIRKCLFFYVKIFQNNSVGSHAISKVVLIVNIILAPLMQNLNASIVI